MLSITYYLITAVTSTAFAVLRHSGRDSEGNHSPRRFAPAIILASFISAAYSAMLGAPAGLPDRFNAVNGYVSRYPEYYLDDVGALSSWNRLLSAPIEPGWLLFNQLVSQFSDDPRAVFGAVTFVFVFTTLGTLSKLAPRDFGICVALYFITPFFFLSLFLFKQALAVAVCSFSFLTFTRGRPLLAITLAMVASSFHASALFFVVVLLIMSMAKGLSNASQPRLLVVSTLMTAAYLFVAARGGLSTDQYLDLSEYQASGAVTTVLRGLPTLFLLMLALNYRRSIVDRKPDAGPYLFSLTLGWFSWLAVLYRSWAFRVGWYFLLPAIALTPDIFRSISDVKWRHLSAYTYVVLEAAVTLNLVVSVLG